MSNPRKRRTLEEIIKERREKRDEHIAHAMERWEKRRESVRASVAAAYDARTTFLEKFGAIVPPHPKTIDEMAHRIYEYRKIYYTLLGWDPHKVEIMAKMDAEKWKAAITG